MHSISEEMRERQEKFLDCRKKGSYICFVWFIFCWAIKECNQKISWYKKTSLLDYHFMLGLPGTQAKTDAIFQNFSRFTLLGVEYKINRNIYFSLSTSIYGCEP